MPDTKATAHEAPPRARIREAAHDFRFSKGEFFNFNLGSREMAQEFVAGRLKEIFLQAFTPKKFILHPERNHLLYKSVNGCRKIPYSWLRTQCHCEKCRDPVTDRRLSNRISLELTPTDNRHSVRVLRLKDSNCLIEWKDGHAGIIPMHFLNEFPFPPPSSLSQMIAKAGCTAWSGDTLPRSAITHRWDDCKVPALEKSLYQFGMAKVVGFPMLEPQSQVPVEVSSLLQQLFNSPPLDTPIGSQLHCVYEGSSGQPFTKNFFSTDLTYQPQQPKYAAMFCVENSVFGGDFQFVDSFSLLPMLKSDLLRELATGLIRYQRKIVTGDDDRVVWSVEPLLKIDKSGLPSVKYSPSFFFSLLSDSPAHDEAIRSFEDALYSFPSIIVQVNRGDLLIWDNSRLLQRQSAIEENSGSQHLIVSYY